MQLEVRIPKQGELWWCRESDLDSEDRFDGLFIVSYHYQPQPMYRIYGSAQDLIRSKIAPGQFAIVRRGRLSVSCSGMRSWRSTT